MSIAHGQALLSLCEQATGQVFLVSPFIKEGVLRKLFQALPITPEVTVVTRWIPEEVARGVCDLEIFNLVKQRPKTRLFLHPCLHAKYYRFDSRCLVGSANLTDKALGWVPVPNIELLLEMSSEEHGLHGFEERLLFQSIKATENIRDSIALAVAEIQKQSKITTSVESTDLQEYKQPLVWIPTCISPEYLYKIYVGEDTSGLLTSAVNAGQFDLSVLAIIPGLEEDDFRGYIAAILEQIPVVQQIFSLSKQSGVTSETVIALISNVLEDIQNQIYDAEGYWLVLKKWLLYFFPNRYRVRAATEVFEQARELP